MLDKTKQSDQTQTVISGGYSQDHRLKTFSLRYAILLKRVLRNEEGLDETSKAKLEILTLGTHVPPKYKEPVVDENSPASLSTKIETFSEKTQVYKRKIKIVAQMILVGILSYIIVDFLLSSL